MIAARITKEISDTSRIDVDVAWWLDVGETITSLVNVVVGLGAPGWTTQAPATSPVTPYDPTPLVIQSVVTINAATGVRIFVNSGTPGNVYTVQFVVVGSSTRRVTLEVGVQLMGTAPVPPLPWGPLPGSLPGYVPTAGGAMTGPLLLSRNPLSNTEAATKGYVDTLFNPFVSSSTLVTLPSAASMPIPLSDSAFFVSGTATISVITGATVGRRIILIFNGALVVQAGVSFPNSILLDSNTNWTTAAGSTLSLFFDGVLWHETGRKH